MTYIHLLLILLVGIFLYRKYIESARLRAQFGLFAVRDSLVLLVASGKIKEDNPVFEYHYKRVNALLKAAPKIGVDDILHAVFFHPNEFKDFDKTLIQAEAKIKQLFDNPIMKEADVKEVIESYHVAMGAVLLTHSSMLRVVYYITVMMGASIVAYLPKKLANATRTVSFFKDDAPSMLHQDCIA
ncbi:MAG: hypothetical protein ACXWTX_01850 [Gallionella sp.]